MIFISSIFANIYKNQDSQNLNNQTSMSTNSAAKDSPTTIRYVALGDSYTIGQSIDPASAWPNLLVDDLKTSNINMKQVDRVADMKQVAPRQRLARPGE